MNELALKQARSNLNAFFNLLNLVLKQIVRNSAEEALAPEVRAITVGETIRRLQEAHSDIEELLFQFFLSPSIDIGNIPKKVISQRANELDLYRRRLAFYLRIISKKHFPEVGEYLLLTSFELQDKVNTVELFVDFDFFNAHAELLKAIPDFV